MDTTKILLDNSIIKENFFDLLNKNNIIKYVNNGVISFYLPDTVFFENFIPLHAKNYNKLKILLDHCFNYCSNVFVPLRKIIEQEINFGFCNNCFYEKILINQFIHDYSTNNAVWNIKKYYNDKLNNKKIFDAINNFIKENFIQICTIKSKLDLENYVDEKIQKYKYLNIDKNILYKNYQKGNSPKENAKEVFAFISSYLLTNFMIYNFNTSYKEQ